VKFGALPLDEALGAIVGHTVRLGPGVFLKKGTVLVTAHLAALRAAGCVDVIAARLEDGDVPEDSAAAQIGAAAAGAFTRAAPAATGRCNLYAEAAGVIVVDRARVERLNLVDEAVTLATVPPFSLVRPGEMIATVKIIPFATRREVVETCAAVAGGAAVTVAPFRPCSAGLLLTRLPGTREEVLDRAAAAQRARLTRLGGAVTRELRREHDEVTAAAAIGEMLEAGCSPILLLGASAIVDRRDVIPAAIERAGGVLVHLGMPVDPGNLLLLAQRGATPILGVPGCARSLKRSGFDMVLERLAAGISVTRADVMTMGVGGLLSDIAQRPDPREGEEAASDG
jgi:molybdenum cofactor cytidylyltransferase